MTQRVTYLSLTRVLACIGVVFLHAGLCSIGVFSPDRAQYAPSLLLTDAMLWTVPCFVMVTGALLLDPARDMPVRKIFGKYIRRVIIALAAFTLLFALFDALVDGPWPGVGGLLATWLTALLTGKTWLHMWYLYMLVGIYLLLPAFRAAVKAMDDGALRYTILILAVFQALVPSVNNFLNGKTIGFYIPVSTVYPLYLLLGYAIASGRLRIPVPWAAAMTVMSEVAILLCSHFGFATGNSAVLALGNNFASVLVVGVGVGVFSLLSRVPGTADAGSAKPSVTMRVMLSIDRCSFGIYLLHVLVVYTLFKALGFNPYLHGGLVMVALCGVAAFLVSWAATWLLRLIPGVRSVL